MLFSLRPPLSVLPVSSSSSHSHNGVEEFTGSVQWGGASLETIVTLQAVLFMGGLLIKYAGWLTSGCVV